MVSRKSIWCVLLWLLSSSPCRCCVWNCKCKKQCDVIEIGIGNWRKLPCFYYLKKITRICVTTLFRIYLIFKSKMRQLPYKITIYIWIHYNKLYHEKWTNKMANNLLVYYYSKHFVMENKTILADEYFNIDFSLIQLFFVSFFCLLIYYK